MDPSSTGLDPAALELLFTRLERPLYNVVYRWLWEAEESREVVQDAFIRLWDMRERVRMETVEPLLWRITLNLASRRRRWKMIRSWLPFVDEEQEGSLDPAEERMLSEERRRQTRAAVESLPEKLRAVVLLTEYSEMSYTDVARALDIPPGTVASRRNAALEQLRSRLQDPTPGERP